MLVHVIHSATCQPCFFFTSKTVWEEVQKGKRWKDDRRGIHGALGKATAAPPSLILEVDLQCRKTAQQSRGPCHVGLIVEARIQLGLWLLSTSQRAVMSSRLSLTAPYPPPLSNLGLKGAQ